MFVETKTDGEAPVKPNLGGLRVDRILALAEEIERPTRGLGFNMDWWSTPAAGLNGWDLREPDNFCGTVCCIGGHADAMFGCNPNLFEDMDETRKLIGLDLTTACQLFYPKVDSYGSVTRPQAARVLRHLAKTGEVNWQV